MIRIDDDSTFILISDTLYWDIKYIHIKIFIKYTLKSYIYIRCYELEH